MTKRSSRGSDSQTNGKPQHPGRALVAWLNDADHSRVFVERLVTDAARVFRGLANYKSLRELSEAQKKKKVASDFWKSLRRLNKTLATFTYAPHVDIHDFYGDEFDDARRVSRSWVSEDPAVALFVPQVEWVIELMERGAIDLVRRCEQCTDWYFARFKPQRFCRDSCRERNHRGSDAYKAHKREYARKLYHLKKSGKVK